MNIWFVDYFAPDISICIFRDDLHFVPACPIFLIPLGYAFAYAGVCHISPFRVICEFHFQVLSYSLRSLIKTGLNEMGERSASQPTWGTTLPSQPSILKPCLLPHSTFFHPHDRMGGQDDLPSFTPCLRILY